MSITINGTTGIAGVDGTSTAPAFQGTDTDTGLFYSANTVSVSAGGSKVATINAYGIGLGTATPSSGVGITFPATQSSSSDANTLDDYEEGTWTPTVVGGSTAGTYTYSTRAGSYIKIGRIVVVSFTLTAITASSAGTGGLTITGFPFTSGGSSSYGDRAFNVISRMRFMANARSNVFLLLGANSTTGYYVYDNNSTGGGTDVPVTDISSGNTQLGATVVYLVD